MNLLITGAWQQAKAYMGELEQQGHSIAFLQYEKDALPCSYEWVEGVICNGLFLHHAIKKFTNLKYIQLTSAGFDRVPMEYVRDCDIEIHNAHGVYSIPMAEFVLAGVLQIYKQSVLFIKHQKEHCWEKQRNLRELSGKIVCIVGCGSVGNACAKRFQAFGCRVIGVDKNPRQEEYFEQITGMERLDEILATADVVVLAVPLTEETNQLMNAHRFSVMKKGAVLVNIARGAVVSEDALVRALREKLGGAVLDVFTEEPLGQESPLWDMEHVILTPHNSFVGDGNGKRLADVIITNLHHAE